MVNRMRHTRAHTANRRSHHALKAPNLSNCAKCGVSSLRHRACPNCGTYKGKIVKDTIAKVAKKSSKSKKAS